MTRLVFCSLVVLGCTPVGSDAANLSVTTTPGTMSFVGRTARVQVVATDADGTVGEGTVELSTDLGTLDETEGALDEFGTFRTTLVCPSSDPLCVPGAELRVEVRWRAREPARLVQATRSVRIAAPPQVFSLDTCPDEARLVYLFTDQADLFSFNPPARQLRRIGRLSCPTTARPNSMAVSQDGTAYLNFDDGKLYRVNVRSATCTATGFVAPSGWRTFGMGFKPVSATSVNEVLFIANGSLATVSLPSFAVTMVGPVAGTSSGPELSGTADGELYAYLLPPNLMGAMRLARIDPQTAALSMPRAFPSLTVSSTGFAYAFTAWSSDFYLYTSSGTSNSSIVRYEPAADRDSVVMTPGNTGIRIVGAGVSRCGQ